MSHIIEVEGLSKSYRLGEFSSTSLTKDVKRRVSSFFGKSEDVKILDEVNDRSVKTLNDTVWSLKNVTFQIEKGDTLGIVGRNGAGKSTLLKILSQITSPTKGEVRMKGKVASLLEVGTGFHPDLSGRDNIFLNGTILGMRREEIQRKFDAIVDFSGVEKYIDTPVKRYSSGMYVRLAFAVAAHLESDILIVDEVLAVGDAEFQKKCIGKMSSVSEAEGKTVIFVSHNLQAVKQLCKSAIMLENGCLIEAGDTNTVLSRYMHINEEKAFHIQFNEIKKGNANFNLKSVSIIDNEGDVITSYQISKPYFVEFKYELLTPIKVKLSLIVSAQDGTTLFGSLNNHESNFYDTVQEPGVYKSVIEIPANFFNNGTYSISLASFMDYQDNFNLDNLLSFEAIDDGVLKKDYFGNFGGYIRPKLQWKTVKQVTA